MATNYVVAEYETWRAHGGAEEGGWYYDAGTLVGVVGTARTEDEAYAIAKLHNASWKDTSRRAKVYQGEAPVSFPSETPRYQ